MLSVIVVSIIVLVVESARGLPCLFPYMKAPLYEFPRIPFVGSSVNRAERRGQELFDRSSREGLALSLALYLKDDDFVVLLHVHCRSARGVGDPITYARHNFLRRLHNFFTLPEGYA